MSARHSHGNPPYPSARERVEQIARRRRRRVLVIALLLPVIVVGGELLRRGLMADDSPLAGQPQPTHEATKELAPGPELTPSPTPSPTPEAPVLSAPVTYPLSGPNTWVYATTQGQVLGTAGTLRRFRIAVETGVDQLGYGTDVESFSQKVDEVLGDPRSWIAGRTLRFQRVPNGSSYEFTVYLATGETARRMCAAGGVDIRVGGVPYTSCRTTGHVIINLSRWMSSVPELVSKKIPLDTYRSYVVNHEVGHQLGYNHERCPRAGQPAPVMQKQTLGLDGCVVNPWPYVNGQRYRGPPL